MILTCPECATSYFVADESLGAGGRRVRCQSCAHVWRAAAEEPLELVADQPAGAAATADTSGFGRRSEEPMEAGAPELPKAFRARAEQQRRLRRAAGIGAVWAGIASGFALMFGAGWLFRVDIVEMYPRTAAAYALAGAPVNPTGLDFEAVTAKPAPASPGVVLISGALRNVRSRPVSAPPIRVALLDAHGAEIAHQIVYVPAPPIAPGAVLGFATLTPDPDGRAADIGVSFAPDAPRLHQVSAPAHGLRPALEPEPPLPLVEPDTDAEVEAIPVMDAAPAGEASEAAAAPHHG